MSVRYGIKFDNPQSLFVGGCGYHSKYPEKARELWTRCTMISNGYYALKSIDAIGSSYEAEGDLITAEKYFNIAYERGSFHAQISLADLYFNRGDVLQAAKLYHRSLRDERMCEIPTDKKKEMQSRVVISKL